MFFAAENFDGADGGETVGEELAVDGDDGGFFARGDCGEFVESWEVASHDYG